MSGDTSKPEGFSPVWPRQLELILGALRVQPIEQHTTEMERAANEFQAKTNLRD